jgi:hypothetical protein
LFHGNVNNNQEKSLQRRAESSQSGQ